MVAMLFMCIKVVWGGIFTLTDTSVANARSTRDMLVVDQLGAGDLDVAIVLVQDSNNRLACDASGKRGNDGRLGRHFG